jgi:A/G-specific adenine glycosylase
VILELDRGRIRKFQEKILGWYAENKRDFPWREVPFDTSLQARDPYKILVSEVMLQQTQVGSVIPKYKEWLRRFTTVEVLARASAGEVLGMWSGLGYNRRALHLHRLAKLLVSEYSEDSVSQRVGDSDVSEDQEYPPSKFSGRVRWPRRRRS